MLEGFEEQSETAATTTVIIVALLSLLSVNSASAQEPKVRTSLATQGDLWVGQRLTLVVELLAPGFFASAATFDLPDPQGLLLMPPTGHPVVSSEEIDGASYTVQRHELSVFPEHKGPQTVPSLTVRFAFKRAPLDTNEVPATVKTAPVRFNTMLPPGAEKLGNVISARSLKAEETWQPEPGKTKAKPGDAFTRTITFSAPDVPAMVLPPFPAGTIDGLGVYAKQQVLDQIERGELHGQRRDIVTYVCQRPGQFRIPAASLTWWDLEAKQLRTIDFPSRTFDVAANPAQASPSTLAAWWKPVGSMLLILVGLALACYARLRPFFAALLAVFRPVHLLPLNPLSNHQQRPAGDHR